jgi:hypothetical protein
VEGREGRDHNPEGFTMELAGGVKSGFRYRTMDGYGYHARPGTRSRERRLSVRCHLAAVPEHQGSRPSFVFFPVRGKLASVVSNPMRCPMVARGRVQNGIVVLDEGVRLPEGLEVTVLGPGPAPADSSLPGSPPHSVLDIPTVSLGPVLRPLSADDDRLGEMLEGRT